MEIRAKCKFDYALIKALVRFSMFKREDPGRRMRFWSIAYAILLAVIILEMIAFGFDGVLLVLLGIEIIWFGLMCFWYFLIPKIQYRSLSKMKDMENEYIFFDDQLKVFTKSKEIKGESTIEYSLFAKVFETTKYFFLYQPNNQVFVVDKSTIEGGSAEDIGRTLSAVVKNKYVVCK